MKQVCIKNFSTEIEAELAQNMLEARGIKSVIQRGGYGAGAGPAASGVLGADLFVLEKDFEEAKNLLEQK